MSAGQHNITIEQGTRWFRTITVTDDGTARDLTNFTIAMQIRETKAAATTLISLSIGAGITITDATNGIFTVEITAAQTAALSFDGVAYYDMELTPPSSTSTERLIEGTVTLSKEVTR